MKQLTKKICGLIIVAGLSQNLMANIGPKLDLQIPEAFSGFKCTEKTFGNSFKTVEHSVENGNQVIEVKLWNLNEVIETSKFQVTSSQYQGGMLLKVTGVEMSFNMGTEFKKIELLMSTTRGENHSILVQPSEAELSCQF